MILNDMDKFVDITVEGLVCAQFWVSGDPETRIECRYARFRKETAREVGLVETFVIIPSILYILISYHP